MLSAMQKFWKSVKIWQSYWEFKGWNFFETQCGRPARSEDCLGLRVNRSKTVKQLKSLIVCQSVVCVWTLDAMCFQVAGSGKCQAKNPSNKVVKSLNLGRSDLYIVTDVAQLKFELEVYRYCHCFYCFWQPMMKYSMSTLKCLIRLKLNFNIVLILFALFMSHD